MTHLSNCGEKETEPSFLTLRLSRRFLSLRNGCGSGTENTICKYHSFINIKEEISHMKFDYAYGEMLDRALSKLPEKVFEKSRFEIPKSDSFTMGNRTVVRNFQEIAQKFNRDPDHLMKFLSGELATSGNFESRGAVFQGRFSSRQINEKIVKYANAYVLCHECGKPDTRLYREGRIVFLQCEACGARHSARSI
jgi:translation initiation factor 2 subunit 2